MPVPPLIWSRILWPVAPFSVNGPFFDNPYNEKSTAGFRVEKRGSEYVLGSWVADAP